MLAWAVQAQNPWQLSALSGHHQPQAEPPSRLGMRALSNEFNGQSATESNGQGQEGKGS